MAWPSRGPNRGPSHGPNRGPSHGPNRGTNSNTKHLKDEEEMQEETFTVFEGKPEELGKFLDEHKPSDPVWNT